MNDKEQIEYLQKVIDKLIFSNMQKDREYSLTLNFGIYTIRFDGDPKNTLHDAQEFFKNKIDTIMQERG